MTQARILRVAKILPEATLPVYGSGGAAGLDLSAAKEGTIKVGEQTCISTGLIFQIPENFVGVIFERSGLSFRNKLARGAGVIDSDYRGEVKIMLRNHGDKDFEFKVGDRIAQMLILKAEQWEIIESTQEELTSTERGQAGFGSTGVEAIVKLDDVSKDAVKVDVQEESSKKRAREEEEEEEEEEETEAARTERALTELRMFKYHLSKRDRAEKIARKKFKTPEEERKIALEYLAVLEEPSIYIPGSN